LLRILATLLRPSGGEVRALGCALPDEAWKLRGRIGFLGHEPLLYRDLSGRENLRFQARPHGVGAGAAAARRGGPPRGARGGRASCRRGCASAWRSAAASCTSPSCCCSTSPTPTSTSPAASWRGG